MVPWTARRPLRVFLPRLYQVLCLAVLAVSIAVSLKVHALADLRFPPPWTDEADFLWQAINVARHGTLLAPQLNTERIVLWMLPGYQTFMALVFIVVPFSLVAARAVSWLLMLLAYLELLWLCRGRGPALLVVVAGSFWYLSAAFVLIGNTARMEPLLLVLLFAAFGCLDKRRPYVGLALLVLCPLVHPAGFIFLGAGLLYILLKRQLRGPVPRFDRAALALTVACTMAACLFVMFNWQTLCADMAYQFRLKAEHHTTRAALAQARIVVPVIVVLTAAAIHVLAKKSITPFVVLAVSLLVPQLIADELFYEIYTHLAFLIGIALATDAIVISFGRHPATARRGAAVVVSTLLVAGLLLVAHSIGFIQSPLGYPGNLTFGGMRLSVRHPYLTAEDRAAVTRAIHAQLADSASRRVSFWPLADGLLYWPEAEGDFLPYQMTFTDIEPDMVVFHASRYIPGWWQVWADEFWQRYHFDESDLIRRRDSSEAWYVKKAHK